MKRQPDNSGFTLVEVLTVILIMVILAGILTPTIMGAKRRIARGTTQSTINLLDQGCKIYFDDFKVYPDSTPSAVNGFGPMEGRHRLVQCLTGYIGRLPDNSLPDRNDGYGFRLAARGTVYGPYNGAEKVETTKTNPLAFLDSFGNEIYYYCGFPNGNPNAQPARDPLSPFLYTDNTGTEADPTPDYFETTPPDHSAKLNDYTRPGSLVPTPSPLPPPIRSDYIIISRGGPHKWWGRPGGTVKCDDVTNFASK